MTTKIKVKRDTRVSIVNDRGPTRFVVGQQGPRGRQGLPAGVALTFSTTTSDADPGQGLWRANSATFASITKLWIDNLDNDGDSITTWLDALDDLGASAHRGVIRFEDESDPHGQWAEFNVTGSVTDKTGYRELTVTPRAQASWPFSNAAVTTANFNPTGATGSTGATGRDAGINYKWNASTTDADPGTGKFLIVSGGAQLNISETDDDGGALSAILATWDDGTSTIRGKIYALKVGGTALKVISITGTLTDAGAYDKFAASVTTIGSFSDGDECYLTFVPTGDKGDTGSTGAIGATGPAAAVQFNFSTTTADADPGSGIFRLNNATAASATAAYFDNNEKGGTSISAWLDTFDDSGNSTLRGYLFLFDPATPATFYVFGVSGSVVDGTGYRKVTIAYVAGQGTLPNAGAVGVVFAPRGPAGTGDLTSTNNLSDLANVSTARTNLGVAIGSNVQAYDVDLDTLAALGNYKIAYTNGSGNQTALALGADKTILAGNGTSSAPSFRTAANLGVVEFGVTATFSVGYNATSYSIGSVTGSNQTITPNPALGNYQHATLNGSSLTGTLTFDVPSSVCSMVVEVVNGGSGAVGATLSTSNYTKVTGDSYATTNGNKYLFFVTKSNGYKHLHIQALQ